MSNSHPRYYYAVYGEGSYSYGDLITSPNGELYRRDEHSVFIKNSPDEVLYYHDLKWFLADSLADFMIQFVESMDEPLYNAHLEMEHMGSAFASLHTYLRHATLHLCFPKQIIHVYLALSQDELYGLSLVFARYVQEKGTRYGRDKTM